MDTVRVNCNGYEINQSIKDPHRATHGQGDAGTSISLSTNLSNYISCSCDKSTGEHRDLVRGRP